MGRLKMLLPFGDRPMLARVLESLGASGVASPIIVVTGHAAQEIRSIAVEYEGVLCTYNADYADKGMLSSVKAGVRALPGTCDAFFLVLGDQPMVNTGTLRLLHSAWQPATAPIVVPSFQGKRGHPVLIACRWSAEILALSEPDTLKTFIQRHADTVRAVPIDDIATVEDIDTPEDYENALRRFSAGNSMI